MYMYKILIVDDDRLLQNSLRNILSEKYDIAVAGSGEEALHFLKRHSIDLVLLDIRLPDMDGIETLRRIKAIEQDLHVIMMTAYEDVKTVIISMKVGACDYLVKPLEIDELEIIIEKTLEKLKLKKEVEELRKRCMQTFNVDNFIGESDEIKNALDFVDKVAKGYDTTVLLEGESGVGKEIIARTIHHRSERFLKPFVGINCAAINKDLLESELFGYERGAFTGGLQEGKKGKIELADGGTLLFDEIGNLLPSAQVKLLRFLEEKEFYPVGGTQKKKVDVRIIAATNRRLKTLVKGGKFREDLYYRLNVAAIFIPPLRERRVDIIPLALSFMHKFNEKFGRKFRGITEEAQDMLVQAEWKGNVRELRNLIERIVLIENDQVIRPSHLSGLIAQNQDIALPGAYDFKLPPAGIKLDDLNKGLIWQALEMCKGNRSRAAKLLGISRPTLIYRLEKYAIKVQETGGKEAY
jgi:DNA-binding NtrC family response regulator